MHHLLLLAAAVGAFEDLELLDDRILTVAAYGDAIDKRLKLAECMDDPVIAPAVGGAVVVRCPALGWRLRVPVKAPVAPAEASKIIVRNGELVECVSGVRGFAVSVMMVAMEDALAG